MRAGIPAGLADPLRLRDRFGQMRDLHRRSGKRMVFINLDPGHCQRINGARGHPVGWAADRQGTPDSLTGGALRLAQRSRFIA